MRWERFVWGLGWVVACGSGTQGASGSNDAGRGEADAAIESGGAHGTKPSGADGGHAGTDHPDGGHVDGSHVDGSHGATSAPDAQTDATTDGPTATCLGSMLLAELGHDRLLVGGMMADTTASTTPIDLRYIYLSGGLFDGTAPCASCATSCTSNETSCANAAGGCAWWGCWQYDQNPPGETARDFVTQASAASPGQIPMFTYYEILQASGAAEGAGEVTAANDATFMERYFADWRFLLQQVAATGDGVALLQLEPDFWGYAEQVNDDPHAIPAAVASANPTDCAAFENSIAGFGQCLVSMVPHYAPHARVGLNASGWASGIDVLNNSDTTVDVPGEAQKVATFLAACGVDAADFVTVETSDRDSGYYASIGQTKTWDATNRTIPDFTQAFTWVTSLTEGLGKPAIYWQTPLGNANQNDTPDHWQDNRVDYFFAHMPDLAAAHVVGVAYGAGASGQTTPETDGGNFIAKVKAYAASGGQRLCP